MIRTRVPALLDLDSIAEYIGRSSPKSALRFLDAFDRTVAALSQTPHLGALHETSNQRLQGIRIWPVRGFKNFLILFRPIKHGIEVLRVLPGARDIEAVLAEEGG